jgi:hypothetical protein
MVADFLLDNVNFIEGSFSKKITSNNSHLVLRLSSAVFALLICPA